MKGNVKGRILAWVLTIMMVVSYTPQIAFATDTAVTPNTAATEATHEHDHEAEAAANTAELSDASETGTSEGTAKEPVTGTKEPVKDSTATTKPSEESTKTETKEPVQKEQTKVERALELMKIVLDGFGVTEDMRDDEIAYAIQHANVDDATGEAMNEVIAIATDASDSEVDEALSHDIAQTFNRFYTVMEKMNNPMAVATLSNYEPVAGISVSTTEANSATGNGNKVVVTRTGNKASGCGSSDSSNSTTITITCAESTYGSILGFSWNLDAGSLKVDGASASNSGNFSKELTAESNTFTFVLTSPTGDSTGTLTLDGFNLTSAETTYSVTVDYDATIGSVNSADSAVTSGTIIENVNARDGVALTAVPNSGVTFEGWVDVTNPEDKANYGKLLSKNASFTLTPLDNMCVKAVFAKNGGAPCFALGTTSNGSWSNKFLGMLGTEYSYKTVSSITHVLDNFTDALEVAAAQSSKTIVLLNNGTLSQGDYVIPSGITLLIPFDSNNTLYTTQAVPSTGSYVKPTAYRTLTMESGTNITVNGAISLSAQHLHTTSSSNGSSPTGPVSFINMKNDSNITVNNGGALYAYGFITGSGSVTGNSGASIYENFQVMDFRGGSASTSTKNGVFPFSQYYVQNIEVPIKLYSGAKEYSFTSITMSSSTFGSSVAFISNSNAMFNLTSGYVVKDYIESTDRLYVEAHGEITVSPINMEVGSSSINSEDFELPINNNISVGVKDGSTITMNQNIALLPGAEIIIDEGCTGILGTGNNFYLYDADQWGGYTGTPNAKLIPVTYAPGRTGTRTEADLVDAKIVVNGTMDASKGSIYTTMGGADISSTGAGTAIITKGTNTVTYQVTQIDTSLTYHPIEIESARLRNDDGTYTITKALPATTTINFEDGRWTTDCEHDYQIEESEDTITVRCDTDGNNRMVCVNCGIAFDEIVPKLGHILVKKDAAAKTCTTAGNIEHWKCERVFDDGTTCGMVFSDEAGVNKTTVEAVTIPASHNPDGGTAAVPATCAEEGSIAFWICQDCGNIFSDAECSTQITAEQIVVPAINHANATDDAGTPATCVSVGYEAGKWCPDCQTWIEGHEEIEAINHRNAEEKAQQDPTCTAVGYEAGVYCPDCQTWLEGHAEIPATNHVNATEDAGTPATCETSGYTAGKWCPDCQTWSEGHEVIPAINHENAEDRAQQDATCDAIGYTAGKYCPDCEEWIEGHEEIEAINHRNAEEKAQQDPTCTENGYTAGKYCPDCDTWLEGHEVIPAAHKITAKEYKAATCLEAGHNAHWSCDECGKYFTGEDGQYEVEADKVIIEAINHKDAVSHEQQDATCDAIGYTAGKYCPDCKTWIEGHEEIEAINHRDAEDRAQQDATCDAIGYTAGKYCPDCDTWIEGHEEIEAINHKDAVSYEQQDATCDAIGYTAGKYCPDCEKWIEGHKEIEAINHKDAVSHEQQDATCDAIGYTAGKYCPDCETWIEGHKEIEAINHRDAEDRAQQDATCDAIGYTAGKYCPDCETWIEGHEEIPAINHEKAEDRAQQDETCTENGYTAGKWCPDCEIWLEGHEVIPAAHKITAKEYKAATCLEAGHNAHWSCDECGNYYGDKDGVYPLEENKVVIPAINHKDAVSHEQQDATCDAIGYTAGKYCPDCEKWIEGHEEIEAINHKDAVGHEQQDATCDAIGYTAGKYCPDCEKWIEGHEEIEAINHRNAEDRAQQNETCTENGYTEGKWCPDCNTWIEGHEVIPAAHKTTKTEAVEATCSAEGNIEYWTCNVCEKLYADEACTTEIEGGIDATIIPIAEDNHKLNYVSDKPASCTEEGYASRAECEYCDYVSEGTIIPKLDHDYNESVTEPTCEKAGTIVYSCKNCTDSYTEEIPAINHKDAVSHEQQDATCEEIGYTAGKYCPDCETWIEGHEKIEAINHKDAVSHEQQNATCDEIGYTAGKFCPDCEKWIEGHEEIEAINHRNADDKAQQDETCIENGYTAGKYCPDCDTWLEGHEVIPAAHKITAKEYKAATCLEQGHNAHWSCDECGTYFTGEDGLYEAAEDLVIIPAINHKNAEEKAQQDATCEEIGYTAGKYCPDCETWIEGHEEIEAINHKDAVSHEQQNATCDGIGYTAGKYCPDCKTWIEGHEEIEAINHKDAVSHEQQNATCDAVGYTAGKYCPDCETWIEGHEEIEAINHKDAVSHEQQNATCDAIGYTTGKYCPDCKTWIEGHEEIEAINHRDAEDRAQQDATCDAIGYTAGKYCPDCDTWIEGHEEIEAINHRNAEDKEQQDETCTENGYTAGKWCPDCKTWIEGHEVIPAAHKITAKEKKDATCLKAGYNAHWSCDECGTYYGDKDGIYQIDESRVIIPAINHSNAEDRAQQDATCEKIGYTAGKYCPDCETWIEGHEEIEAINHKDAVSHEQQDATCDTIGYTAGKYCPDCESWIEGHEELEAINHRNAEDRAQQDETCTENGYTAGKWCPDCKTWIEGHEVIPAAHKTTKTEAVSTTCTIDGNIAYWTCGECNKIFSDKDCKTEITLAQTVVKTDGHKATKTEAKAETCTVDGNIEYWTCSVCKKYFADETCQTELTAEKLVVSAKGHNPTATLAKAETCTVAGNIAYWTCNTCNKMFSDEDCTVEIKIPALTIIAAKGHDKAFVAGQAATCTEAGWEAYEYCMREECDYTTKAEIPATGHQNTKRRAPVAATCTTDGYTAGTWCNDCETWIDGRELIPAKGHSEVKVDAVAATCTTEGNIEYWSCPTCKKLFADENCTEEIKEAATVIKALEHDIQKHEAKAPTEEEIGWEAYETCKREGCEYTTYIELPVLTHTHRMVHTEAADATCTADGNIEYWTCEGCGNLYKDADGSEAVTKEMTVITKLGHDWKDADCETPKTCGTCGETEGEALGHDWLDATCTEAKTCLNCEATEGEALGHDWKDATCEAPKTCDRCNVAEGEALGHDWKDATCEAPKTCDRCNIAEGEALGHAWKAATCETAKTCETCGAAEGEALGHDWKDATCEAPKTCGTCGVIVGEALGHDWKDATCEAAKTCGTCGATVGEALGHDWKDATCEAPKTCGTCGATAGEAINHANATADAGKAATCTESGFTAGKYCADCDKWIEGHEVIDATNHADATTDAGKAATCTESGFTAGKYCADCDKWIEGHEVIDATNHADAIADAGKAATCTESGYTAGKYCADCDKWIEGHEVIDATNHANVAADAGKVATCTESGYTAGKYCADCDKWIEGHEVIDAAGHKYGEKLFKVPTSKVSGGYYEVCSVCDYTNWIQKQTYKEYVKAGVNATTLKSTVTVSAKTENITVKWSNNSDFGITYYNVYRSTSGKEGTFKVVAKVKSKSYVDKNAKAGQKYYYRVIGYRDVEGTTYKTKTSNTVSAKIKMATVYEINHTPMYGSTNYVDRGLKVMWTSPNVKVDGYEIFRSKTGKAGSFKLVKTTKSNVRSWTNKGLKVGERYFFEVRGFKYVNGKKIYTEFSEPGYRYVLAGNDAKLASQIVRSDAVKAKKAVKVNGGIKVTWNKDAKIKCNRYEVWRSTSKNGTYTKIATTKNKYYTDKSKKLKNGKRYYYKIVGYRDFGKSCAKTNPSNVVSAVK